jgi:hypothetical protein
MNKLAKNMQEQQQAEQVTQKPAISEEELIALFSKGEKAVKTPRNANQNKPQDQTQTVDNQQQTNKSKNKKKKNKK